jgi:hypothetical protein
MQSFLQGCEGREATDRHQFIVAHVPNVVVSVGASLGGRIPIAEISLYERITARKFN